MKTLSIGLSILVATLVLLAAEYRDVSNVDQGKLPNVTTGTSDGPALYPLPDDRYLRPFVGGSHCRVGVMAVAVGTPIGYDGRRWPAGRRVGSQDGHSARSTWQEEAATDAITRAAVMRRERPGSSDRLPATSSSPAPYIDDWTTLPSGSKSDTRRLVVQYKTGVCNSAMDRRASYKTHFLARNLPSLSASN